MNDPLVQLLRLDDLNGRRSIYEVKITTEELNSKETFCTAITKLVFCKFQCHFAFFLAFISYFGELFSAYAPAAGHAPEQFINPQLIKSLVG